MLVSDTLVIAEFATCKPCVGLLQCDLRYLRAYIFIGGGMENGGGSGLGDDGGFVCI